MVRVRLFLEMILPELSIVPELLRLLLEVILRLLSA